MNSGVIADRQDLAEELLSTVRRQAPVVDRVLSSAGNLSLAEYLQRVCRVSPVSFQSCSDIAEVIHEYVEPLLGKELAERTAADFLHHPVALTTNHHGVDFFAQSVQGSMLFGLAKRQVEGISTIPVFSCANIPLDNVTYPRGALLYGTDCSDEVWPLRIPFFSNKLRRQPVAWVKTLDSNMMKPVLKRIGDLAAQGVDASLTESLLQLIGDDYLSEEAQAQQSYSAQSVILNARIWSRLFTASANMPQLVTIELEKLTQKLLLRDLQNSGSLATLLFDNRLISKLYQRLNGVAGCWNKGLLEQRWQGRSDSEKKQVPGSGTFCFWGVDKRFRRIPLMLMEDSGQRILCGCDDNGVEYRYSIEAESLAEAISQGQLMPSIFSCFLTISLARGVTCLGGYYQADYLPQMQLGVVDLLMQDGMLQKAGLVTESFTEGYLSGMQTIMLEQGQALLPAGPLEILASGRVTLDELEFISGVKVSDAHSASLIETVADVMPGDEKEKGWLQVLAGVQHKQLADKVVIRRLP
ncbi:hypothetical protein [Amphritea japonica]|uniref:Uncharacterized protein n=1 Tax=Amphritea japonica ATCC BAA-1530 TaxID=1278309 RepID=A0A7R6STN9_9GAMM|nr:hypothetical protein [Amphritea japonica]BBB27614.1 conserved hypothetical protein [Amphritea japonica ATCC BAA-1530]